MSDAVLKIHERGSHWFVVQDNEVHGPFLHHQIQEKLNNKEISLGSYCWKEGFGEWRLIASAVDMNSEEALSHIDEFPKIPIPSAKPKGHNQRRRSSDNMSLLDLAPESRKVVKVNFSKTRVRRMSVYEWALAMAFCVFCSYFAASLTVETVLHNIDRTKEIVFVAGTEVSSGYVPDNSNVYSEQQVAPLLSAPAWGDVNGPSLPLVVIEFKGAYQEAGFVSEWKLNNVQQEWSPQTLDISPVYQRPGYVNGLAPTPAKKSVEVLNFGEPYVY